MAKKQIEFDDDFDLDNFEDGFGSDDGGFDGTPVPDNRKPVTKLAGSFTDGATSKLKDPQFHRKMIEKSLPKGYAQTFDATEQVYHSARDLYDTAGKEVGKTVKDLKRLSGSVAKAYGGVMPKRIRDKFVQWGEEAADKQRASFDPDDMEMQAGLGDIFGAWQAAQKDEELEREQQKDETDEKKQALRDSFNAAQQDQIGNLLFGIRNLTKRQVAYQDQVTTAYRRKALELQYKQLFMARKTHTTLEQLLDLSKNSYEILIKNTALPEIVKVHTSELAGQMLKQKFFGNLMEPITPKFAGIGRRITNRFKGNIKGFFTEVGANINDAIGMMDMLGDTMGDMQGEGGTPESLTMQGGKMVSSQLGARAVGYGSDQLSKYLKEKAKQDPRIAAYGLALENMFMTNTRRFNDLALGRGSTGIGWLDSAFNWLGFEKEATRSQSPLIQSSMEDSLEQPVQWNLMAQRTLTEVIPEWLSSMDNKLGVIAFGSDRQGVRKFDFKTGSLKSKKELADRFREETVSDKNLKGLRDSVEETVTALLNGERISDKAMVVLRRTVMKMTIDNKIPEPIEMATDDQLYDTDDPMVIDEIKQAIRLTFKISDRMIDDYEVSQDKNTTKRLFKEGFRDDVEFQQRYNKLLRNQLRIGSPDIMKKAIRQAQMQNNDVLTQMDFIDQKDDGSIQLNWKKYIETVFPDQNGLPPAPPSGPNPPPIPTPPTPPVPPIPVPPVPPVPPTPTTDPDPAPPLPTPSTDPMPPAPPVPPPPSPPTSDPVPPTPDGDPVPPPAPNSSRWKRLFRIGGVGAAAAAASGAASASTSIGAVAGNLVLPALTVADGGLLLLTAGGIAAGKFAAKWWKNRKIQREQDMSDLFDGSEQTPSGDTDQQRVIRNAQQDLNGDQTLIQIASHTSDIRGMLAGAAVTMGWLDNINIDGLSDKLSWLEDKAIKGKRKITELGGKALGAAKDYGIWAYGKAWTGASKFLPWAGAKAGQTKDYLTNKLGPVTDIYIKGKSLPVLLADKLKLGVYVTEDGTPIKTLKDILTSGGNIYELVEGEDKPRLVLSVDDIKQGLYDFKGFQILKNLTDRLLSVGKRVLNGYRNAWNTAKTVATMVKDFITMLPDIYVKGEDSPRLTAYMLRDGKYLVKSTGKVVSKISDITGDIVHVDDPERVILTANEIRTLGLVDVNGEPILDLKDKLINKVKSMYRLPAALVKRGFKSVTDMLSTGVKKLWDWVRGDDADDNGQWSLFSTNKAVVAKLDDIYLLLDARLPGGRIAGDLDGDGDRDNSSEDIRQRRRQEREDQRRDQDETDRRNGRGGGGGRGDDDDGDDEKESLIGKLFSSTAGKVLMAGGAMALASKYFGGGDPNDPNGGGAGGGAPGSGMMDEDGTVNWTKAAGYGIAGYGAYRGLKWGLGKVGQGVGWLARKAGSGIRTGAQWAGRGIANQLGRMAVGQAIRTGAVWAGTALAGIISAPVLITAAVIGAVAFGGYLLYKKMKQNADPIVKFRMAQYGFDMDDADHVTKLLDTEQALLKYVRLKEDGPAEIGQGLALKTLLDLFGVDEKDKTAIVNWNRWFQLRFKPVFISHVTALGKQLGSKELGRANELMTKSQKLMYMSQVHFTKVEGNPYLVTESPFPSMQKIEVSFQTINDTFKWAISKIKATPDKRRTRTPASLKEETERNQKVNNAAANQTKANDRVTAGDLKVDGTQYGKVSKANGFYMTGGSIAETSARTEKMSVYGEVKGTEVKLDPSRKDTHVIKRVIEAGKGYLVAELADGSVVKIKGNRNWRNNNPGNLEYGPYTKELGAIGTDGRFAIFPTYEMGRRAKISLLFGNKNYRGLSLTAAIARYAPAFENNTKGYQKSILDVVGGQNKTMSSYTDAERAAILNAMEKVEGYKVGGIEVIKAGSNPPTKESLDEAKQQEKANQSKPSTPAGGSGKFTIGGGTTSTGVLASDSKTFGAITSPGSNSATPSSTPGESTSVKFDSTKYDPQLIELGKAAVVKHTPSVDIEGLREDFRTAFYAMCGEYFKKTKRKVLVVSAMRDNNKQKALYAAFLARGQTSPLVAPPGRSPHEYGVAVDINSKDGTADALDNLGIAAKYGFYRPLKDHKDLNKREAWHFEHRVFRRGSVKDATASVKKEPTKQATPTPTTASTQPPTTTTVPAGTTVTAPMPNAATPQLIGLQPGKSGGTVTTVAMPNAIAAPMPSADMTPVNPMNITAMGTGAAAVVSPKSESKLAQVQQTQDDNIRVIRQAEMSKGNEQLSVLKQQAVTQEKMLEALNELLDIATRGEKEKKAKKQEQNREGSVKAEQPKPETKPAPRQPVDNTNRQQVPVSMSV